MCITFIDTYLINKRCDIIIAANITNYFIFKKLMITKSSFLHCLLASKLCLIITSFYYQIIVEWFILLQTFVYNQISYHSYGMNRGIKK